MIDFLYLLIHSIIELSGTNSKSISTSFTSPAHITSLNVLSEIDAIKVPWESANKSNEESFVIHDGSSNNKIHQILQNLVHFSRTIQYYF